jgi:hypothetical protein
MSSPVGTKKVDVTRANNANGEAQDNFPTMQFEPILEALEKHGPIFRREQFEAAYAAYHAIDNDEPETETYKNYLGRESMTLRSKVTLLDIYGVELELSADKAGIKNTIDGIPHVGKRLWDYSDLQALAWRNSFGYGSLAPFQFFIRDMPVEEADVSIEPEFHRMAAGWRAAWEASGFFRKLTAFFAEHAGEATQRIDKIVCFGLGLPVSQAQPRSLCRSYIQHLAACTIRDLLPEHQGGRKPKIFAQEPVYGSKDIAYLKEHFDMTILEDPEGFRTLNGNTFVITVAPNVPVRQVAFDMTHEHGGPAGFLCNDIYSEGLEAEGKKEEELDRFTCNPSPALWKYKQESVWMEYDDGEEENWFGHMGVYLKRKGVEDVME